MIYPLVPSGRRVSEEKGEEREKGKEGKEREEEEQGMIQCFLSPLSFFLVFTFFLTVYISIPSSLPLTSEKCLSIAGSKPDGNSLRQIGWGALPQRGISGKVNGEERVQWRDTVDLEHGKRRRKPKWSVRVSHIPAQIAIYPAGETYACSRRKEICEWVIFRVFYTNLWPDQAAISLPGYPRSQDVLIASYKDVKW